MNILSSSSEYWFRGAEEQGFYMRVFISKYELWMITIKDHQFHVRDNKIL
jgi:hypothetical protein